jgi:chaperone required for assembly of F1-ATPase
MFYMFFIPGSQTRKRFYKKVSTVQSNKDFEIILDNRKLKTPAGSVFRVSSEPLALAVANEWDAQEEKILVSSMHLVSYVKSFLIPYQSCLQVFFQI